MVGEHQPSPRRFLREMLPSERKRRAKSRGRAGGHRRRSEARLASASSWEPLRVSQTLSSLHREADYARARPGTVAQGAWLQSYPHLTPALALCTQVGPPERTVSDQTPH